MNDDTIMMFGKHKGKKLRDVPNSWFVYMYDRGRLSGELKVYAETVVPILRFVADKRKEDEKEDYD